MKTEFNITDKFDDPVGNWWKCKVCENKIFIPIWNIDDTPYKQIKFCPFCGLNIKSFTKTDIEI